MHRLVTSAPPWTGSRIHSAPAAFSDWHQLALHVLTQNLSFFGKHTRWQQSGKKQKWLLPTSDEQRCWCSRPTVPWLEIRCVTCGVSATRFSRGGLTLKVRAIYWHSEGTNTLRCLCNVPTLLQQGHFLLLSRFDVILQFNCFALQSKSKRCAV